MSWKFNIISLKYDSTHWLPLINFLYLPICPRRVLYPLVWREGLSLSLPKTQRKHKSSQKSRKNPDANNDSKLSGTNRTISYVRSRCKLFHLYLLIQKFLNKIFSYSKTKESDLRWMSVSLSISFLFGWLAIVQLSKNVSSK